MGCAVVIVREMPLSLLRLCSLLRPSQFTVFLSRLFPCFLLLPSSLPLPSLPPGFDAGDGLYGLLWWKRGRDMVLRAGFLVPARWMEGV